MKIADMVESMLSSGCPPDAIVKAVALMEAKADKPAENRRKYDREYKSRKRREVKMSTLQKSTPLSSSLAIDSDSQVSKNQSRDLFGNLPAVVDDWPEDWEDQFWDKWPRSDRKAGRKQVIEKLARLRKNGGVKIGRKFTPVTWAQIWGGLCAYVTTDPEVKWIPAPEVWVNKMRWEADYDVPKSESAPQRGFGAVAFGRR